MKFLAHKDECVDYDGTVVKGYDKEFDCPFVPHTISDGLSSYCYVIYKGLFGKYKIRECIVYYVYFTNCWSIKMDNGWTFFCEEIGKKIFLHDELDKAIRICEEKNRLGKVKVKYL